MVRLGAIRRDLLGLVKREHQYKGDRDHDNGDVHGLRERPAPRYNAYDGIDQHRSKGGKKAHHRRAAGGEGRKLLADQYKLRRIERTRR